MAKITGGAVFHSGNSHDLDKAALKVAAEIKNLFIVVYVVDSEAHQEIFRFMVIVQRADDPSSTFSIPMNGDHGLLLPPSTDVTFWVQAEGYEKSEPMSLRTSSPDVAADLTVELKPLQAHP